jgi:FkbM family methyltransferase
MLPKVNNIKCEDAEYMVFSGNDGISVSLFTEGKWDEHILNISKIFYLGIDAPLILDIGAHIGTYSIPIAKNIQDIGGKVIAFEPQRIIYYNLCGNIILNRLDNCIALNQAVGNYDGTIQIPEINYNINNNSGAFSFNKEYRQRHGLEEAMLNKKLNVPIIKLNSFSVEKPPALIKLDVEGLEIEVIKGSNKFLEDNNYPPILFEAWHWDWFKNEKEELFNYIKYLGYNIEFLCKEDFVAQHPKNSVKINFTHKDNALYFNRER